MLLTQDMRSKVSIRLLLFLLAGFIGVSFGETLVSAADISTSQAKSGLISISISGEIATDDDEKFKKIASIFDDAVVFLDSPGGSTIAAIRIGEAIRLKGYSTYVDGDVTCASACALIWLAGSTRFLGDDGKVGFHATYVENEGRQQESGGGNALVGRYLTLLNLGENAVYFATSAPPDRLNWLTRDNYRKVGISVELISLDEDSAESEAPKNNQSMLVDDSPAETENRDVSKWRAVGGWTISVDHTLNDSCFAVAVANSSAFRLGFDRSGEFTSYFMIVDENWKSLKVGNTYEISITFDDETAWNANSNGGQIGDAIALTAYFTNDRFWDEFSNAKRLRVKYKDSDIIDVNLLNNNKILSNLIECQKEQKSNPLKKDPFSE